MASDARRRKLPPVSIYLGYAVSVVVVAFGAVLISGLLTNPGMPAQLRIMFGVVLVLWGLYRFVLTRMKVRQWQNEDEE